MAQEQDETREHIEQQRDELGENLQHLEQRAGNTTNWRTLLDRKPLLLAALAFVGGVWLSTRCGRA